MTRPKVKIGANAGTCGFPGCPEPAERCGLCLEHYGYRRSPLAWKRKLYAQYAQPQTRGGARPNGGRPKGRKDSRPRPHRGGARPNTGRKPGAVYENHEAALDPTREQRLADYAKRWREHGRIFPARRIQKETE